jgi:hypothetical protein
VDSAILTERRKVRFFYHIEVRERKKERKNEREKDKQDSPF